MVEAVVTEWPDYELVDFGEGRKLERIGEVVFDRPAPAATGRKRRPGEWSTRTFRYQGQRMGDGAWTPAVDDLQFEWQQAPRCAVPLGRGFQMIVAPRPGGQVGLFPEQFDNWKWISAHAARAGAGSAEKAELKVLNLFAYTGGSTLAAASAGAAVTHVDAAKPTVEAASHNAAVSGLTEAPIRWIVEDAVKFCRREVKRGSKYDAVILDPPTYGHGPKGEQWQIKRDLLPLLKLCGELTDGRPKFVLLTCHTPGTGPAELSAYLSEGMFGHCGQPPRTSELMLTTADGRRLPSGSSARWPG